ncbi:MAG: D-aminoacylase [Chloroflexota bacterium]
MFDLILRNGTIVDGTKAPRYGADVGIRGDRIVQIGELGGAPSQAEIDATGKVVAPGFVDVHNHSDGWLLKTPHLFSNTSQGFTTEVIMADGISYAPVRPENVNDWIYYLRGLNALQQEEYTGWESLGDYMALLDGANVQNSIAHVPYANCRVLACGWRRDKPDDYAMKLILDEIEAGMAAGAVGLSTGMDYVAQCFADTDELVEACLPLVAQQGLYVTHMRYKKGVLEGLKEAVEIGRRAGVPVHISHLKGPTPEQTEQIMEYINTVAVNEVDFSFDVYPYMPGSTMLNYLLPYEVWEDGPLGVVRHLTRPDIRARFAQSLRAFPLDQTHIAWLGGKENSQHQGKLLSDYITERGLSPADALCDLLIEENLTVLLVLSSGDDQEIEPFLSHPNYMMGSDGIFHQGPPDDSSAVHPRQYGSTARVLGPCVRDRGLFSLEEAVYKLSGYPAQRFGLTKRGQVREGWFADLVLFDSATVGDNATYTEPHKYSSGIEHVIVNGIQIVENGQPVDSQGAQLPGRSLRFKEMDSG